MSVAHGFRCIPVNNVLNLWFIPDHPSADLHSLIPRHCLPVCEREGGRRDAVIKSIRWSGGWIAGALYAAAQSLCLFRQQSGHVPRTMRSNFPWLGGTTPSPPLHTHNALKYPPGAQPATEINSLMSDWFANIDILWVVGSVFVEARKTSEWKTFVSKLKPPRLFHEL